MENYKVKLKNIKAFAFDVDGVLTNGQVICFPESGDLVRSYDAKDGFALRMALMKNYPIGIITGGTGDSITKRFIPHLASEVFSASRDKVPVFMEFCKKYSVEPHEVAYVGDDIPDIGILKICGLAVAPADAVNEVKEVCDFVSEYKGGKGCVRNLIEQVLKIQNRWDFNPSDYSTWRGNLEKEAEKER